MEEYIIRGYKDGDEKEINDLFNEIFHEKRSLTEWFWKFKENPLGKINLITIAESKGKIIGQYINFPTLFKYKEKILRVVTSFDNFVHPEFRGGIKGVQKEMFDYVTEVTCKNNIVFGFGFPNKAAYIFGKRILKYKDLGKIQVLFKRLNWNIAVKTRFPWLPYPILEMIRSLSGFGFKLSIRQKSRGDLKGIKIRAIDSFDERFDLFWDQVKEKYGIIGVRDQKYLNWRFKKPESNYRIYTAEKGNEIVGYIVISVKRNERTTIGYIIDLLTLNNPGIDTALIRHAFYGLISQKVDFVLCWMFSDKEAFTSLQNFGFIERDNFPPVNVVYFVFNPDEVDETYLKDPKNWYLTIADSDAF